MSEYRIPEDADQRRSFERQRSIIGGGDALLTVAEGLRAGHMYAEYPQGSWAKSLAIWSNEAANGSAKIEAHREEIARLRAALEKYGDHRPGCLHYSHQWPCTCGFSEALAAGREVDRG